MPMFNSKVNKNIVLAVYLTLLISFVLRLFRLDAQSFWYDEGFSAFVARGPLSDVYAYVSVDPHPPLYYLVLHFWMKAVGESEFSLRFLSVALGVLSTALIYQLGSDLMGHRAGLYAAILGTVNPFLLYYSQETRGYMLLLTTSMISNVLFFRILSGKREWAYYCASIIFLLWTHYFAIFVVGFHIVLLTLTQVFSWKHHQRQGGAHGRHGISKIPDLSVRYGVISFLVAGIAYLPWVFYSWPVISSYKTITTASFQLLAMIRGVLVDLGAGPSVPGSAALASVVTLCAAIVVGFVISAWTVGRPRRWLILGFLVLGFFLPIFGLFFIAQDRPTFHPRYLISVVPLALIAAAAAPGLLHRIKAFLGWGLMLVLVLSGLSASLVYYFNNEYARHDFRSAARFVEEKSQENDVLLFNAWYTRYVFDYYYRGQLPSQSPKLESTLSSKQATDLLNEAVRGHDRLWLVLWQDDVFDPGKYLINIPESQGRLVEQAWLGPVRVFGYELPHDSTGPFRPVEPPLNLRANFGDELELLGYTVDHPSVFPEDWVRVSLFWRGSRKMTEDYTGFVHLLTPGYKVVTQQDKPMINSYYPTSRWSPQEVLRDEYIFQVPKDTPAGEYLLEIGVYSSPSFKRLNIYTTEGMVGDNIVLPSKVTVNSRGR